VSVRSQTGRGRLRAPALRWGGGLAIALLLACPAHVPAAGGLQPVDEAGYRKLLDRHRGQVVLVDFWATWCEPCRQEMPALVRIAGQYAPAGFRLITISADDEEQLERAAQFLRLHRAPFPAYYKKARDDTAFINSVEPAWSGALPALFLYRPDGRLAAKFIGETEPQTIEGAVRKLLAARPKGK